MENKYDIEKFSKKKTNPSKLISKINTSTYVALFLLLTYVPIVVMMVLSFSSGKSVGSMGEASGIWYTELFNDSSFMTSILVSIIVSFTATFFSLVIGTLAAIGLHKNSSKWISRSLSSVTNYPIFAAEIVMGVSLMVVFLTFGVPFGMGTLIFSHIMFCTPYVIISVMPRLKQLDSNMIDASFDLGAKPMRTLKDVILPNIKGAMFVGASIAFAMSFDDFIISYLTSGSVENVSVHIYSIKRITPIIYAFGTILVVVISGIFVTKFIYDYRVDRKLNWKEIKLEKDHKELVKVEYAKYIESSSKELTRKDKKHIWNAIYNDFQLKIISIEKSQKEIDLMEKNMEVANV